MRSLLAVMAALTACADARANQPAPPAFVVHSADGKSLEGPLRELTPDWSVRVGEARVDGADVLTVRRVGRPLPALPADAQLLLTGGDRVPVMRDPENGLSLKDDRVHFRCPCLADGKEVSIPLSAVSAIWYAPTAGEHPERLRRRLAQETRKTDVVLLRNGDALEGVLTALDMNAVVIEVNRKPVTVSVAQTAAVALSSDLTAAPKPKGVFGRVVLDAPGGAENGARLSLASARCDDGETLTGTTLFGAELKVPLDRMAAVDLFHGKAVYLSELDPTRYEYFPYLDDRWEWSRDAGATGLDLRLGGSAYDRGVGMHSHSRLTYAVPKDSRRFEATVGLDDRGGPRGSVRIRVLADGKPVDLGADRDVTAGAPLSIGVDVGEAKEWTLEVDFGKGGPVQDHVDWVDARFIK